MSELFLNNVVALAEGEDNQDKTETCYTDISCDPIYGEQFEVYYCSDCVKLRATSVDGQRTCTR